MKLSCAMIVKNEERYLERCLKSIIDTVDEIIVVDTGSTDNTIEIAKQYGAAVYKFKWCDDFSSARNYSLDQTTGDWIIVIDADEYMSKNYRAEIEHFIHQHPNAVGKIKQLNRTLTDDVEIRSECNLTRLFPKGLHFKGLVHEQLDTDKLRLQSEVAVYHDGYYTNNKVSRNLPLLLKEIENNPEDSYLFYQVGRQYALDRNYNAAMEYYLSAFNSGNIGDNHFHSLVFDIIYASIQLQAFDAGLDFIDFALEHYPNYAELYYYCGIFFMEAAHHDIDQYGYLIDNIEPAYLNAIELGDSKDVDGLIGAGTYLSAHNLAAYYESTDQIDKAKQYYDMTRQFSSTDEF